MTLSCSITRATRALRLPLLALLAGLTLAPGIARADTLADFRQTCRHYENRARFLPRDQNAALTVILAEGCRKALGEVLGLRRPPDHAAGMARLYLERLTELRQTLVRLNIGRAYTLTDRDETRATRRMRVIASVSPVGEYLIARELGVIEAYRGWSGLPGFRLAEGR